MRGALDLTGHKLAGLYKPPARKTSRNRSVHAGDAAYRQIWRIVDGAIRDTLENHPEYLTKAGSRAARNSLTKRVVGSLHGYATQVAKGRSTVSRQTVAAKGATGLFRSLRASRTLSLVREWLGVSQRRATNSSVRS